jgi:hypothetical protein
MKVVGGVLRAWAVALLVLLSMTQLMLPGPASAQTTTDLPGVLGKGDYESPQFGTQITWTDAWDLGDVDDPHVAHAIGGYATEPVVSDPAMGDMIYLSDTDTDTAVISISLAVTGSSVDDLTSMMETDAFLENTLFMDPGAEVLSTETSGNTVGLLVRDTGRNSDHALFFVAQVPRRASEPTIAVAIDLFDPETYEASLGSAADGLTIEGFDLFATHSMDDLLALLDADDDSSAGTPTPESGGSTLTDEQYLQAVREDTDLRKEQLDRLSSILFDSGTITAADNRELERILGEWKDLQPIAAPEGYPVIDDEHRALVKNLNALATALLAIASGDLDDAEQQQQVNLAGGALQTALALIDELDESLGDEGV